MTRDRETGAVTGLAGRAGVQLDWSRISARAAQLDLDLQRSLCSVSDPEGAEVRLPNGLSYRARVMVANYRTLEFSSWNGRIDQVSGGDGRRR
jgi:hypothetical protein